ncbi:MAG: tetratricopeptide repeat protein [Nitrospirae bacterium]|nr:tetratricopeptide repeat protein [Nitrospirota bacterium]
MFKFMSFITIVFLFTIFYLALYNMNTVKVMITNDFYYELPQIALIMISITAGSAFMFLVFVVRDTRNYIKTKKIQKKRKRDEIVEQYYSKAINNLIGNRVNDAIEDFELALKENNGHVASLIKLGDIYYEEKDDVTALEYYQKALKLDEQNIEALCKLAGVKMREKKYGEAEEICEKILGIEQDNLTALYIKRKMYEKQSEWDNVLATQKLIINVIPNGPNVHEQEAERLLGYKYEHGRQCLENNILDMAKKEFREILKERDDFIPAHLGIAEVLLKEESAEAAVSYLEKARELTKSTIILARLEDLLITTGEPSRLLKIYRTAQSEDAASDTLRLFQGKLYYRLEMLDEAMDSLKGFDSGVFYPELHMLRGGIYLKRGECEKAAEEFLKIIDLQKALWIPYICTNCKAQSDEWSGRCPQCHKWNTFTFDLQGICKI